MTFSFNPALPADLDWIRADLGDTESTTALLSNEQITAVLTAEQALADGSRQTATWRLAAQALAVLTREPVKLDAAGAMHDYTERLKALAPLANAWRTVEAERLAAARTTPTAQTVSVRARPRW